MHIQLQLCQSMQRKVSGGAPFLCAMHHAVLHAALTPDAGAHSDKSGSCVEGMSGDVDDFEFMLGDMPDYEAPQDDSEGDGAELGGGLETAGEPAGAAEAAAEGEESAEEGEQQPKKKRKKQRKKVRGAGRGGASPRWIPEAACAAALAAKSVLTAGLPASAAASVFMLCSQLLALYCKAGSA